MRYETIEIRMKARYYKFIAMLHTCFYKVFLELYLGSCFITGDVKNFV